MTTPDVTVEVDTPDVAQPSDDTVVTVIAPDGGDGNDLEIGLALGNLATVVQSLQSEVSELRNQIGSAQGTAEVALDVALDASVTAEEAVIEAEEALAEAEEAAEDSKDDVIEPDREHWLWKRRGGLKPVEE